MPRPLKACASDHDGDCTHALCPQLRDGEPAKSGRHCPIDIAREQEQFEAAFAKIWGRPPVRWEGEYVYSENEWRLWQVARVTAIPQATVSTQNPSPTEKT